MPSKQWTEAVKARIYALEQRTVMLEASNADQRNEIERRDLEVAILKVQINALKDELRPPKPETTKPATIVQAPPIPKKEAAVEPLEKFSTGMSPTETVTARLEQLASGTGPLSTAAAEALKKVKAPKVPESVEKAVSDRLKEMLPIHVAASIVGVTAASLYSAAYKNRIPWRKLGNQMYIRRCDAETYAKWRSVNIGPKGARVAFKFRTTYPEYAR